MSDDWCEACGASTDSVSREEAARMHDHLRYAKALAEAERDRLARQVEQLIGDVQACAQDYTEATAVLRLITAHWNDYDEGEWARQDPEGVALLARARALLGGNP